MDTEFDIPLTLYEASQYVPEERLKAIMSIENSFGKMSYSKHVDAVEYVGQQDELPGAAKLGMLHAAYQEYSEALLAEFGISLTESVPLATIAALLICLHELSSPWVAESVTELDITDSSPEEYLAAACASLSDIRMFDYLHAFVDVDSALTNKIKGLAESHVEYLDKEDQEELEESRDDDAIAVSKARVKKVIAMMPAVEASPAYRHITTSRVFPYGLTYALASVEKFIEPHHLISHMAEEYMLIFAGSDIPNSTPWNEVLSEILEYVPDDWRIPFSALAVQYYEEMT